MRGPAAIKRRPGGCPGTPGRRNRWLRPGAITFARVSAHNRRRIGRRTAALGLGLCLAGTAAAQNRAAAGAEVGYSRADLIGANADIVESKRGAITGVYLHFPVSAVVAIRPELLFSLRGGRTVVGIAGTDDLAVADLELAYLELPLLARLVWPRGQVRPAVFGGPSPALRIGCDLLFIETGAEPQRSTCGQEQGENPAPIDAAQVRPWDLGWIAGAALELYLPRTTLSLQGRYTEGFRSVLNTGVDLKNRAVALLFGLTF
jgi:Outer membrane protein beta-barrel domain